MSNDVSASLPALTGYGFQALTASADETLTVTTNSTATLAVMISFVVPVVATDSLAATVYHTADIPLSLTVNTSASLTDIISVVANTLVRLGFSPDIFKGDVQVWVTNVETNASTRYDGYDFNSYGMFDGHYVGVRDDGVYLLEGADDAGVEIESMVDFGDHDFGMAELKHMVNAYFGMASDSHVHLRVTVGEDSYLYRTRSFETYQHQERVDTGRGLRSNLFGLELYGNGAKFTLRSADFAAIPTQRRI